MNRISQIIIYCSGHTMSGEARSSKRRLGWIISGREKAPRTINRHEHRHPLNPPRLLPRLRTACRHPKHTRMLGLLALRLERAASTARAVEAQAIPRHAGQVNAAWQSAELQSILQSRESLDDVLS